MKKGVPWYKRLLFKNLFVELKEDKQISRKTGIKWGFVFIALYFISIAVVMIAAVVMDINIKNVYIGIPFLLLGMLVLSPSTLFLGLGIIYYSKKYSEAD